MSRRIDLVGQTFGRLTVVKRGKPPSDKNGHARYTCICECGRTIDVLGTNLTKGNSTSCGCKTVETNRTIILNNTGTVHGTSITKISSKKTSQNNTSGVRGVSWHSHAQKWTAYIIFQRKRYDLGYFKELEDAAMARKEAESKIYGDFLAWYSEQQE